MADASWSLQQALYAALTGNVALAALVTGVFDHVPEGTRYPYVTIGDSTAADWSAKRDVGQEHTLTLHVWSQKQGRAEVKQIMSAIHTALHEVALVVSGASLAQLRHDFSETFRDPDGITYHGVIRFRANTTNN